MTVLLICPVWPLERVIMSGTTIIAQISLSLKGQIGWEMARKRLRFCFLLFSLEYMYKIKRKSTFFRKYQKYFILWGENISIFTPATHSCKNTYFHSTQWNIFDTCIWHCIHLKQVNIFYRYTTLLPILSNQQAGFQLIPCVYQQN